MPTAEIFTILQEKAGATSRLALDPKSHAQRVGGHLAERQPQAGISRKARIPQRPRLVEPVLQRKGYARAVIRNRDVDGWARS